jgi:hypothetical protein
LPFPEFFLKSAVRARNGSERARQAQFSSLTKSVISVHNGAHASENVLPPIFSAFPARELVV